MHVCVIFVFFHLFKYAEIRGEQRLAVGLARPRVKMVSCSRWMVGTLPLDTKELSKWKSMVTCVSVNTTSFSFISFRTSTASVMERKRKRSCSQHVRCFGEMGVQDSQSVKCDSEAKNKRQGERDNSDR